MVIYWSKINMNPNEKRTMGFTYGLGRIAGESGTIIDQKSSGGKIRLFTGPAKVGKPFVATAYIKKGDGQNVTMKLPAGVKLCGAPRAPRPSRRRPARTTAQVSWRLLADKSGEYVLEADLDDGAKASDKANVRDSSIFD